MTHFADLSPCTYHRGVFDDSSWECALLAIGWIENMHPFETGIVEPEVVEKLLHLTLQFREAFPAVTFRGLHMCSICERVGSREEDALKGSAITMLIPGESDVFAVPGRVDHYIVSHSYRPPEEFVRAVMQCPAPGSEAYMNRLTWLNDGVHPPFDYRPPPRPSLR